MIRDRGRHAKTIDRPAPRNRRREHLVALHMAVQARRDLAGRLVSRQGVSWVNVARCDAPRRTVDVACDYRSGGWRFCRLADGGDDHARRERRRMRRGDRPRTRKGRARKPSACVPQRVWWTSRPRQGGGARPSACSHELERVLAARSAPDLSDRGASFRHGRLCEAQRTSVGAVWTAERPCHDGCSGRACSSLRRIPGLRPLPASEALSATRLQARSQSSRGCGSASHRQPPGLGGHRGQAVADADAVISEDASAPYTASFSVMFSGRRKRPVPGRESA